MTLALSSLSVALPAAPVGALVEHGLLFDSIDASAAVYASPPYVLQWCPEIGGAGQMVGSRTVADTLRAFPPSVVIDVGAYDGADALGYAKAGHTIYSFQPTPSKGDAIEAKYRASPNAANIRFYRMAISNRTGSTDFWVSHTASSTSARFQSSLSI